MKAIRNAANGRCYQNDLFQVESMMTLYLFLFAFA